MFDLMKIGQKISEAKAEMEAAQRALAAESFTAESGGGLVKVSMGGDYKLSSIEIDPQLLCKKEQDMLQDLIIAATHLVVQKVEQGRSEMMKSRASGILPQIPGLDISKLF